MNKTAFAALVLVATALGASAVPTVFNATESAGPGEALGIQGHDFGSNPQVLMTRVSGSETTITPNRPLTVRNRTTTYVSTAIPANEPMGLYAVQVVNGTAKSPILYINRARSWTTDHHDEAFPGARLRLFGRNLRYTGASPQVRFVHPNTGASTNATLNTGASDDNVLELTVPTTLTADVKYRLFVRNGYGAAWGEREMICDTGWGGAPITSGLTIRNGSDPFGVGEAWARNFSAFSGNVYNVKTDSRLALKATGNGTTDDRAAIQAAIDRASADGGGVVYIPSGTYRVNFVSDNRSLWLRSRVVVRGDGKAASILRYGGGDPGGDHFFMEVGGVNLGGIVGISLDQGSMATGFHGMHGWGGGQFLIKDSALDGVIYIPNKNRVAMIGNNFDCLFAGWSHAFFGHEWGVYRNNHFYYYDGRIHFNLGSAGTHDILWESNRVTRDPARTSPGDFNEYGGLEWSSVWNGTILNSTFDQIGTATIPDANDTETILNQDAGGDNQKFGNVSSATPTTITDPAANFPTYSSAQGYIVSIVSGPGSGQWQWLSSNTSTTLTIRAPWQVTPTSASRYAVTTMGGRNWLVKGNTLSNRGCRGIWIYSVTHHNLNIVNNRVTNCDGIDVLQFYMAPGSPYTPRFNTSFGLYVADNIAENLNNTRHPVRIGIHLNHVGSTSNFGTGAFVPEFRRNTVNAYSPNNRTGLEGEGYWCTVIRDNSGWFPSDDTATVGILGAIFDGNFALDTQDAYRVSKGVHQAMIARPLNQNVANRVLDFGSVGTFAQLPVVIGVGSTDDTNPAIVYSPTWTGRNPVGGRYLNTTYETNVAGQTATVSFIGTSITLRAEKQPYGGTAQVFIDGIARGTASFVGTGQLQDVNFTYSGLSAGAHTLHMVANGNGWTYVDKIDVN